MSTAPTTVAASMRFTEVATMCQLVLLAKKTATKSIKEHKRELLRFFIEEWRKRFKLIYPDYDPTSKQPLPETFFPFMRLIIPDADKERQVYGIKENTLAKIYIDLLGLNSTSADAQKLLEFKRNFNKSANERDFAAVAFEVFDKRLHADKSLTVEEVNKHLDDLAMANAAKGDEKKDTTKKIMMDFLRKLEPVEQKWLIRIILKEMKLGMTADTIFDVFHPDAKELYDISMSISTVCTRLHDPKIRLSEIEVQLFCPIKSMLADVWHNEYVPSLMKIRPFIAETKFDGDRCQIHKQGDEFRYYSRGGVNNTDLFGKDATAGYLTPFIHDCFDPKAGDFIIDGEICAYNTKPEIDTIVSRMESTTIKKLDGTGPLQSCFVAFDILLFNGKPVTNLPLKERLTILDGVFQEEKGRLYHSKREEVNTPQDCYNLLNKATVDGQEGIMVKDSASIYKPAGRTNCGWYKFKTTDAAGGTHQIDTLDLLIVGGYFGKRAVVGSVCEFLMAVAETPPNPGENPVRYLPICTVGTGYSMNELGEIGGKLEKGWKPVAKSKDPPFFKAPAGIKRPDLWIAPSESIILELKANEILKADKYDSGYSLRFPRVKTVRFDKPWTECMTLKDLEVLREACNSMLGARNVGPDHFGEGPKKRQKLTSKRAALALHDSYVPANLDSVEKEGTMLNGKRFYVAGGDASHSKQDLERLIARNGGRPLQFADAELFCILTEKMALHVENIVARDPIDVVKPEWLHRCIAAGQMVAWHPKEMLFTTERAKMVFDTVFDEYGDSYVDDISRTVLDELLAKMKKQKLSIPSKEELAAFEEENFVSLPLVGLFRTVRAFVDKKSESNSDQIIPMMSATEATLMAHDGQITDDVHDEFLTHVVVHSTASEEHVGKLKTTLKKHKKSPHFVTEKWVHESVDNASKQTEEEFAPFFAASNMGNRPSLADLF